MKLQVKSNFSFSKLAQQLPKIIEKHIQKTAKNSAQGAKEAINKGLSPPLKKSTIEIRKARGRSGTKPLFDTGKLYKSIKGTQEGLKMLGYGVHHQYGFIPKQIPMISSKIAKGGKEWFLPNTKGIKVPARPFMFPSEKTIKKSFDEFSKDIKKAILK